MKNMGGRRYSLWDEEDGFFYDVLRYPDGSFEKFRVRSLVGLIPLYAVERLEERWIDAVHASSAPTWTGSCANKRAHRAGRLLPAGARRPEAAPAGHRGRAADEAPAGPRARRGRVPLALGPAQPVALPRAAPVPLRRPRGALRAGGGRDAHQGRQLELARAGLVPDDVPDDRVAAQAGRRLRARPHGARAGRRGPAAQPLGGGGGHGEPHDPHLHARRDRPPALPRRPRARSRTTRTGATWCSSTSTSTARRAKGSAPRTRPAGRRSWRR